MKRQKSIKLNKYISILGYGEVGRSIERLYLGYKITPKIKDKLIPSPSFDKKSILNVCIPFTENFLKTVCEEIERSKPILVIIHSTLPIGTTKQISNHFLSTPIVHSPVRGNHPNLTKSLKTFVKYIGSENKKHSKLAKDHFKSIGIKSKILKSSINTEVLKLSCTTFYGLCIAWYDYLNDICNTNDISFKDVLHWQDTYNEGYSKLNQQHFVRPLLSPPKNKKIGGHCIIPNAKILNNLLPHVLVEHVIKFE